MRNLYLLLLFLALSFSASAYADSEKEGPIVSGGGSGQTAEFYRIARGLTFGLFTYKDEIRPQLSLLKLQGAVNLLQVEPTTEQLFKDEMPVEALNYPVLNKVRFNSQAWGTRTRMGKIRLVMHELLGLLEVPDPQYNQSDFLAEQVEFHFGDVTQFTQASVDGVEDSEKPITCTIYGRYPNDIAAQFPLVVGGGGAVGSADFRGLHAEVYIGFEKTRQIRADIWPRNPRNNEGPELAYMTDIVGDFVGLQARGPHYSLKCEYPITSNKPYIRKP